MNKPREWLWVLPFVFPPQYIYHEQKWIEDCPAHFKPLIFRRYVDDRFIVFPQPKHAPLLRNYLNSKHQNIKFSLQHEADSFFPIPPPRISHSFYLSIYPSLSSSLSFLLCHFYFFLFSLSLGLIFLYSPFSLMFVFFPCLFLFLFEVLFYVPFLFVLYISFSINLKFLSFFFYFNVWKKGERNMAQSGM